MFGSRVGFSGTADIMALFPVRTNSRWRPPPSWKNLKWPYLRNSSSRSTYIARIARTAFLFYNVFVSSSSVLLLSLCYVEIFEQRKMNEFFLHTGNISALNEGFKGTGKWELPGISHY